MSKFLTDEQIREVADKNGLEFGVIKAIYQVESKGKGFLASGEPKILFERHIFWRELNTLGYKTLARQMSALRPDLCHAKPTPKGGYGKVDEQHQRLQMAQDLLLKVRPDSDENLQNIIRECALKACSWGLGQIMGFNHKLVGYDDLQSFINAMYESEQAQLQAMINFLKSAGLTGAMNRKDWHTIARTYNGKNYQKFNYHNRLAQAYTNA
ncbi:N-acetylmuramidase family protein [Moraxella sp. ZY210820]|uniref:N-acetylmuramidase family protein n=1 Tax=unclassified Moraxella TaxID=2685852 RepID=UPI00272F725A|nr:N-acetylmuramidase family protein [Moraxella sp. ZY210820]WLF83813.1 N-acetylmuramidase family protein [Moraxella sp. ZY210820]